MHKYYLPNNKCIWIKKSYKCSRDDDGWTSITFTLQDGNNLSDCHTYTTPSTTTKATKLKTETKPRRWSADALRARTETAEDCTVFENHRKSLINLASEASYVYILSGQKLIKKTKKWSNLASFWKSEECSQTVLPDRSTFFNRIKIGEKWQKWSNLAILKNLKLAVKQCYQTGQLFNRTKNGGKCQNVTF